MRGLAVRSRAKVTDSVRTQRDGGDRYRSVQPWGRDRAREATLISEHATAADAFAEIDRLSVQMVRTGAPSDAVELIVVDAAGGTVLRPDRALRPTHNSVRFRGSRNCRILPFRMRPRGTSDWGRP